MDSPTVLVISKSSDKQEYKFMLSDPFNPIGTEYTHSVPPELQENIKNVLNELGNEGSFSSLDTWGKTMYDVLLPEPIQDKLKTLNSPLLISTNDPTLPWELFHNGEDFLCLRYSVGRKLLLPIETSFRPSPNSRKPAVLLIANPTRGIPGLDLPEADEEVEFISDLLSPMYDCKVLAGRAASFKKVSECLSTREYDVIHYSGHVELDEKTHRGALILAEERKLPPEMIMRVLKGRPLVFLNACHSGKYGKKKFDPASQYLFGPKNAQNLAEAFLIGNKNGMARAFIGTLWRVADKGSSEFSRFFYQSFIKGECIGEALRQAREQIKITQDSTWASFVLYGNPNLKFVKEVKREKEETNETDSPTSTDNNKLNIEQFGDSAKLVLYYVFQESKNLHNNYLGTPHLFIALTKIDNGYTQRFLGAQGQDPKQLRDAFRVVLAREDNGSEAEFGISERFERLLTLGQEYAKLDGAAFVDEKHLLQAFLEDGGVTREVLKELNLELPEGREEICRRVQQLPKTFNYTKSAQMVLAIAEREASHWQHEVITTPHLFIGLTKIDGGYTKTVLEPLGVNQKTVRDYLRHVLGGQGNALPNQQPKVSKRLVDILKIADNIAGGNSVDDRHLLAAVLKDGIQDDNSVTIGVLKKLGVDPVKLVAFMETNNNTNATELLPTSLHTIGRNLTKLAAEGKLFRVVGRASEINRLMLVLSKKTKNNPVLIGEAGVGKTAIVEGLAQQIIKGQVSSEFQGKEIIELSITSLVAGTKYRGEFEARLQKIIKEVKQDKNIILFIDEIHTVVGAGEGSNGSLDAANILKPALARGEIRCIGATTITEYRKYIERDAALERRFQTIMVDEPTSGETLEMLRGTKECFEAHHKVSITDEALKTATDLSVRYLPDRRLPDKAFDIIDEACAQLKLQQVDKLTRNAVDSETVAEVITIWTGIPISQIKEQNEENPLNLEAILKEQIIGQNNAIVAVSQAVKLAKSGLKDSKKPLGVWLFIGPTGVGKTALAKAVAVALLGSEEKMLSLDMSEFMEKHNVAKLIGAPPGYIGYGEEGILTSKLKTQPYSVVLLDELEKAHKDVLNNVFLRIFDEGKFTDAKGYTVNARNAIFIMASNIAADLLNNSKIGFGNCPTDENKYERIQDVLKQNFTSEFISRIDKIIVFNPLTKKDIERIAKLMLNNFEKKLAKKNIILQVDKNTLTLLSQKGYNKNHGVRPLKQAIDELIINPLSQMILAGKFQENKVAVIKNVDGEINILSAK